jgi:hypothetical protein
MGVVEMLMDHKNRLLLVILLCTCFNLFALGQSNTPTERAHNPVHLVQAPKIESQSEWNSLESALGFAHEEPIVLLLCGLALFIGATTIRRKRSSNREQRPRSAGTSA